VRDFIDNHETVYVVEQNRDAQLRSMLMLDLDANPDKLVSILHYDGMPISASFVAERIEEEVARGRAA
jgi:2-oxoglutarate ferredoxin oxidoreductase subunit alpha